MSALEKAWRKALVVCPCCHYPEREQNTAVDGIPSGNKVEIVFTCGAAVFITDGDSAKSSVPCANALDDALSDMEQNVECAADIDEEASDEAA